MRQDWPSSVNNGNGARNMRSQQSAGRKKKFGHRLASNLSTLRQAGATQSSLQIKTKVKQCAACMRENKALRPTSHLYRLLWRRISLGPDTLMMGLRRPEDKQPFITRPAAAVSLLARLAKADEKEGEKARASAGRRFSFLFPLAVAFFLSAHWLCGTYRWNGSPLQATRAFSCKANQPLASKLEQTPDSSSS